MEVFAMKNAFSSFYPPTPEATNTLWSSGLIVCDANVLLNLYRYPQGARDALFYALQQFQDRLWLPHQAGLEFHLNRLTVIAEQKRKFRQVERIINESTSNLRNKLNDLQLKKRHSTINVDSFLSEVDSSVTTFLNRLKALEGEGKDVNDPDPLLERVNELFDEKIGAPPKDQKEVDELFDEASKRFEKKIPPGYMDCDKSQGNMPSCHLFNGLVFQKRFGDYLIWRQMMEHAKANKIRHIMFLSDDGKSDWWNVVESEGNRRVGPRTELVNEICNYAGVEVFKMYSSDRFLSEASDRLELGIEVDAIKQVKDNRKRADRIVESTMNSLGMIRCAADKWMKNYFKRVRPGCGGFPLFVCSNELDQLYGVEVIPILNKDEALTDFQDSLYPQATYLLSDGAIDEFIFLFLSDSMDVAKEIKQKGIKLPDYEEVAAQNGANF